ncbi:hypothetical protein Q7P37_005300 [Cladosporium fusiforme]
MPPTRHTSSDPFTDQPLRHPTIAPPNLRAAAAAQSHHALRSGASTASSRSRQQQQPQANLFAPNLSRKPTSRRATPSYEDEVLADNDGDDAEGEPGAPSQPARRLRHARARHGSPEGKLVRAQQRARLEREREEEADFVVRKGDGSFLNEIEGLDACLSAHLQAEEVVDEAEVKAMDEMHSGVVRHYFTTAPAASTRANDKHERNFEEYFPAIASRVRQQVLSKLESEKWRYEPVNSY